MTAIFDSHRPATAFEHDSTLVVALELSGKSWQVGAVVPGVTRQPRGELAARDMEGLLRAIERWTAEASRAGRAVQRAVVTYEAGRDGFWIARYLIGRGLEVHVMQPASIPVPRHKRRAKTDRIDLDMLLRTPLAFLRGELRVCSMVRIASEAEEDARRPGRERDALVRDRIAIENRIGSLLCLHGVVDFKPRPKKAAERLAQLRGFCGSPLPEKAMEELKRLMAQHHPLSAQIKEIEAKRDALATADQPDRAFADDPDPVASLWAWAGDGDLSGARAVLPSLPPPPGRGRLCRADRNGLPQRRVGARHQQDRQSAPAPHGDAIGLALAAFPETRATASSAAGSSNAPQAPRAASARS